MSDVTLSFPGVSQGSCGALTGPQSLHIRGVRVRFPFEPYAPQRVFMERVLAALQESRNALLESPTGTGKTLCLLCAALAFRESLLLPPSSPEQQQQQQQQTPRVVYASRTHSQLSQVIRELRRTEYAVRSAVLASRSQTCVHAEVARLARAGPAAQNRACAAATATGRCRYRDAVRSLQQARHAAADAGMPLPLPEGLPPVVDVEELVRYGKQTQMCPYYLSRELIAEADLVFLPYNYLIDKKSRAALGFELEGAVVVFDEAHNLDASCADVASFDITASDVASCVREMDAISARPVQEVNPDQLERLKLCLQRMGSKITELAKEAREKAAVIAQRGGEAPYQGAAMPGGWIRTLLGHAGITDENAFAVSELLDRLVELSQQAESRGTGSLELLQSMLRVAFETPNDDEDRFFRVYLESGPVGTDWSLGFWCFSPSVSMASLLSECRVRSIILTSGTLAPLDSMAAELGVDFSVRLENPHVVPTENVWAGVLLRGPSAHPMNSSFKTRENPAYIAGLGQTLVNLARIVPAGMLVFFPSYGLLTRCTESWKQASSGAKESAWNLISKHKQIFLEPKYSSQMQAVIEAYSAKIEQPGSNGAIFLAVARGKVSEGLDFSDDHARAVVVTGLPYPNLGDPKVRLKRSFMDDNVKDATDGKLAFSGSAWYSQQAMRAVNQSVGRVIRHIKDYGCVILCDERFAPPSNQAMLSAWLRPSLKVYSTFGDFSRSLSAFFKEKRHKPEPIPPAIPPAAPSIVVEAAAASAAAAAVVKEEPVEPARPHHHQEKNKDARPFISKMKKLLSADDYARFIDLVKQMKIAISRSPKDVPRIVQEIKELFALTSTGTLWSEFVHFIPAKLRKAQARYKPEGVKREQPTNPAPKQPPPMQQQQQPKRQKTFHPPRPAAPKPKPPSK